MQRLHVELPLAFQLDNPHCRVCRGLGNCFGIAIEDTATSA
jgi:hypothetical protein